MDPSREIRPQLACLITTCLLSSLVGVSLAYLGSEPSAPSAPQSSGSRNGKSAVQSSEPLNPLRYTLKNHGGRLAVFESQSDTPFRVYDVYINTLPTYDQELLQEGVSVEGETALARLIEDYVS